MKRLFCLAAFVALSACALSAQAVSTTVCDVLKDPSSFDGKTVTIKGTVLAGFDQFVLNDGSCAQDVNGIWLDYPAGSKAKGGPEVMVTLAPAKNFAGTPSAASRTAVTLNKDKNFKQFDSALSSFHTISTMCLGCTRYEVQATVTGRLDGVKSALIQRKDGKITTLGGFGNLNQYPARLVIASVADVSTKEVDFSKADAAAKEIDKQNQSQQQGDQGAGSAPVSQSPSESRTALDKLVGQMAANSMTSQIQKDLATLGKPNENNGIVIGYGIPNEAAANEGAAGASDSPDGVIYQATFNKDKLQNLALTVAILHVAQHITDIRAPIAGNEQAPMAILENNAWAVGTTLGIFGGEKEITGPGGYVVWYSGWPKDQQISNMQTAMADLVQKEEMLNR
jgi:hypothetical protein